MKIQKAVHQYLDHLEFDRRFKDMPRRRQRMKRLVMFFLHRQIESLERQDFTIFFQELKKCQASYVNMFIFSIRGLLAFWKEQGLPVFDGYLLKPLRVYKKVIMYLSKSQAVTLLDHLAGNSLWNVRNQAITAIILDTGARISECLSLDIIDVNNIMLGQVTIKGKLSKERPLFFTWSRSFIQAYLDRREDSHEALFITHCFDVRWRVKRLQQDGYRQYLRKANRVLNFQVSPHILRKTALNNWKNNGMELKAVSLIAGHDSVVTTEKFYLGVDWNKLQAVHKKFSWI